MRAANTVAARRTPHHADTADTKVSPLRLVPESRGARPQDSAFANGVEITITLAIFVAGGLWADSRMGTTPWITVAAAVFALVGQFVRTYYSYNSRMRDLEQERRDLAVPGTGPADEQATRDASTMRGR